MDVASSSCAGAVKVGGRMRSVPGGLSEKLRQPEEEICRIDAGTLSSLTASDHAQWRGHRDESAKQASTTNDILAQRTHSTSSSPFASLPHVTRLRNGESSVCNTAEKIPNIRFPTPEALPKFPTRARTVLKTNISDATPEAPAQILPTGADGRKSQHFRTYAGGAAQFQHTGSDSSKIQHF